MQVCQVSASSSIQFLRRILNIFRKFTLYVTRQPIKLSDLDNSRMKHGGLLNTKYLDNSRMKHGGLLNTKYLCKL